MAEGIRKINEWTIQNDRSLVVNTDTIEWDGLPNGTLLLKPDAKAYVKKTGVDDWVRFLPSNLFDNKTITGNLLADSCITNVHLSESCITSDKIQDGTINTKDLADYAITTDKLADDCITMSKIPDNSIEGSKLSDQTITEDKIKDFSISMDKLVPGTITASNLADESITTDKFANESITTDKIANGAVTTNKISNYSITSNKLAPSSVTTSAIADRSITNIKIQLGAIEGSLIAPRCIDGSKIGYRTITEQNIAAHSITDYLLQNGCATTNVIRDRAVNLNKLATDVSDKINSAIRLIGGVADVRGTLRVYGDASVARTFSVAGTTSLSTVKCSGTLTAQKVYNAVYNDLAEGYIPGEDLLPGDIVEIKEDGKVYKSNPNSTSIVGVVSDEYAACYGATEEELASGEKVAVGLIGKIHVTVEGPIKLGQRISCYYKGIGKAINSSYHIGKAIENKTSNGIGKVLCLVYPN